MKYMRIMVMLPLKFIVNLYGISFKGNKLTLMLMTNFYFTSFKISAILSFELCILFNTTFFSFQQTLHNILFNLIFIPNNSQFNLPVMFLFSRSSFSNLAKYSSILLIDL